MVTLKTRPLSEEELVHVGRAEILMEKLLVMPLAAKSRRRALSALDTCYEVWDVECFVEEQKNLLEIKDCESLVIARDLFQKLSSEAKAVFKSIVTTPDEVLEALGEITIKGDNAYRQFDNPRRIRRYIKRELGEKVGGRVIRELRWFLKNLSQSA